MGAKQQEHGYQDLWELMRRDALGQEFTDLLVELHWPSEPDVATLCDQIQECKKQLCTKYNVDRIYIPDPIHYALVKPGVTKEQFRSYVEASWTPINGASQLYSRTNWASPVTPYFTRRADGRIDLMTPETHPLPPPGEPPRLTVTIDLSMVTQWDIEQLATEFKRTLRTALQNLPPARSSDPSELAFLKTITKKQLEKDLKRYDLYRSSHTYRQIAALEAQGRHKRPSEDSVERSVRKIHSAIHRTPLQARRRRLDAPAEAIEVYTCPEHPTGACSAECAYCQSYMKRFNTTAPGPDSGMGFRAMSLADYEEPQDSRHTSAKGKSRLRRRQR